tara:strand:+ start:36 stop:197 length:162 start_codon:yes stop_codon:yes gene_type:complete
MNAAAEAPPTTMIILDKLMKTAKSLVSAKIAPIKRPIPDIKPRMVPIDILTPK